MKKLAFLVLALAGLSGCATIVKGPKQTINISTTSGTKVNATITNSKEVAKVALPQTVLIARSSDDVVINIMESECVLPSKTIVKSRVNEWFFGNFILGGLLGSTTDSVSGAAWKYDDNVVVNLASKNGCKK